MNNVGMINLLHYLNFSFKQLLELFVALKKSFGDALGCVDFLVLSVDNLKDITKLAGSNFPYYLILPDAFLGLAHYTFCYS